MLEWLKPGMDMGKMGSGLGGMLGMNRGMSEALPGLMGMMGQGMQGQAPQQPPQAPQGPMNNPAAIQAAVEMMRRLGGRQQPYGGFPPGLLGQFPGTRDKGIVNRYGY